MKSARGRPSLHASQPEFLSVIADIAIYGCAADERRRKKNVRSVNTRNELSEALWSCGC